MIHLRAFLLSDDHLAALVADVGPNVTVSPRKPGTDYEHQGDVSDVVFPCGWILRDDGDTLDLYYGGADSVVCLATASLRELLDHLGSHASEDLDMGTNPRALAVE